MTFFLSQAWMDARDYCCSIGMYLATFANTAAVIDYQNAYKSTGSRDTPNFYQKHVT
jgi:hypothetical protein